MANVASIRTLQAHLREAAMPLWKRTFLCRRLASRRWSRRSTHSKALYRSFPLARFPLLLLYGTKHVRDRVSGHISSSFQPSSNDLSSNNLNTFQTYHNTTRTHQHSTTVSRSFHKTGRRAPQSSSSDPLNSFHMRGCGETVTT